MGIKIVVFLVLYLCSFSYSKDIGNVIKPGSQLQVNVIGLVEDLSRAVVVRPDGKIFLPWAGEIKVDGLSFDEAAKKIKTRLERYFKNFEVIVGLGEIKPRFSILGNIVNQGMFDLPPGLTVAEAISLAGGITPKGGYEIKIIRGNREIIFVDLNKALTQQDLTQNVTLYPGDIVFVPESITNKVVVFGQVARPGEHRIQPGTTLSEVVVSAGGLVSVAAAAIAPGGFVHYQRPGFYQIRVRKRDRREYTVYMDPGTLAIIKKGGGKKEPIIQSGDVIFVRELRYSVIMLGEVNRPLIYEFREGDRVIDAITMAGGFGKDPHLKEVGVIRMNEEGKKVLTKVNMEALLRHGDITQNIPLKDKDIVFVPSRTRRISWDEVVKRLTEADIIRDIFRKWF